MRIKENLPPPPPERTFVIEANEEELRFITQAVGKMHGHYDLYMALKLALGDDD